MRKASIWILTAAIMLTFVSTKSIAATGIRTVVPIEKSTNAEEAAAILARIDEIHAMDKSKLTMSEKRVLRKEVRQSKKKLNQLGGGVYISAGALIVILLLLIILL